MPRLPTVSRDRVSAWLERWRPLLPIFGAEFVVLIGFGALLPVLPLYIREQGIDAAHFGVIIAAWPLAKLVFEPFFGWWADRHARKPQMVLALLVLAVASLLPLFLTSFAALFVLRFVGGMAAAAYDPPARGMITDATTNDERGEAFGFYAAFQVGGFAIGPALGGLGAMLFEGYAFPFVVTALLSAAGAVVIWLRLESHAHLTSTGAGAEPVTPTTPGSEAVTEPGPARQAPLRTVFNRTVLTALVFAFGLHFTFGTYEVVWALYLVALGATVGWVGFSFVLFSIPEMLVAPFAGRYVDRHGPLRPIVLTGLTIIVTGTIYALSRSYELSTFVAPIEAGATAAMLPALFSILGRGTPHGRSAFTQGLFGATATLAFVVASILAGVLFEINLSLPFLLFVAGIIITMTIGLLLYRTLPSAHRR